MTKRTDEVENHIRKILEDNAELFQALSDGLLCPCCGKITRGTKFNLGEEYNWFEGCKDCYEKIPRSSK